MSINKAFRNVNEAFGDVNEAFEEQKTAQKDTSGQFLIHGFGIRRANSLHGDVKSVLYCKNKL